MFPLWLFFTATKGNLMFLKHLAINQQLDYRPKKRPPSGRLRNSCRLSDCHVCSVLLRHSGTRQNSHCGDTSDVLPFRSQVLEVSFESVPRRLGSSPNTLGFNSYRVMAPSNARSIGTHRSAGTFPRSTHCCTAWGVTPRIAANFDWLPARFTAFSIGVSISTN